MAYECLIICSMNYSIDVKCWPCRTSEISWLRAHEHRKASQTISQHGRSDLLISLQQKTLNSPHPRHCSSVALATEWRAGCCGQEGRRAVFSEIRQQTLRYFFNLCEYLRCPRALVAKHISEEGNQHSICIELLLGVAALWKPRLVFSFVSPSLKWGYSEAFQANNLCPSKQHIFNSIILLGDSSRNRQVFRYKITHKFPQWLSAGLRPADT